jgi:hypothetical protein
VPILVAPLAPTTPPIAAAELTDVIWTGANGAVVQLTDWSDFTEGTMITPGVAGHLMPTWDFYADRSPSYDGENVRGVRANPRDVVIPIHIWGPDRNACSARLRALVSSLNPQLGPGTLTFREPSGTTRSIPAYYSQGLEGNDDDDKTGRTWLSAVLSFHAPRPFWEGDNQTVTFDVGGAGLTFFPVLPLQVRNSQVLIAGDTAVIDFRETAKTALLNGVTNLYPFITLTSSAFWPLIPGTNNVTITLPGAAGTTTARLDYKPRYLTAW